MKTYDHVHLGPALTRWLTYRRLCLLRWLSLQLYVAMDSAREAAKRLEADL